MADYKCPACPMRKRHLYLAAGLIWGIPGVIITLKGIDAYRISAIRFISKWHIS